MIVMATENVIILNAYVILDGEVNNAIGKVAVLSAKMEAIALMESVHAPKGLKANLVVKKCV